MARIAWAGNEGTYISNSPNPVGYARIRQSDVYNITVWGKEGSPWDVAEISLEKGRDGARERASLMLNELLGEAA